MRIALYLRVSTSSQSLESQTTELRDYCHRRGWTGVKEFCDVASGAKSDRRGLDALMREVRRGKVDAILCYKLDRLGRSLAHLAQIVGELTANRVALICPSQGIDSSADTASGMLQLHVLAAVAEFERSIIRDRVNSGLKAAKARGVRLGRPSTLQKHLPAVKALVARGAGPCAVSRELKLPLSSAHKLVKLVRSIGDSAA